MRKYLRYFAYFLYIGIFITAALYLCTALVKKRNLTPNQDLNLTFNLDNCSIAIIDADSSASSSVYVAYKVPSGLFTNATTTVILDDDSAPQNIQVLNGLDPRYCSVKLYVKPKTPLKSLQITCPSCNITQNTTSQLIINNALSISGQSVSANFRNVKVGSFSYEATTGYLQLNNIDSSSNNNSIKMDDQGDIIIQSTKNFQINAISDTQAFCFSAPFLNQKSSTNCIYSGQSKYFLYLIY